jgi:hypothetical protein
LFAILADVRNGRGFAGVDTGDGFNPIDEPRGVPADACPEYLQQVEQWDGDGHSHSYFTLAELIAYDWENQHTNLRGVVSWGQFVSWFKNGKGAFEGMYCGATYGQNIITISQEDAEKVLFSDLQVRDVYKNKDVHVKIQWQMSYAECCSNFLEETIPVLENISEGDNEGLRIVFFFDN